MLSCMQITMPSTIPKTMPSTLRDTMPYQCQSQITENTAILNPSSHWAIPYYTTTMTFDIYKLTSNSTPYQTISINGSYEPICDTLPVEQ